MYFTTSSCMPQHPASPTHQTLFSTLPAAPPPPAAVKKNDLSLYVTAEATGCLPGMIAVATACEVDPTTKRPILGTLNICPSSLTGRAEV